MGFLDKISKSATDAATRASSKAEELLEVNKLKGQQNDLKNEVVLAKKKMGEYVYTKYLDGEELDETLTKFCKQIEKHNQDIEELEEEINDTREAFRARKAEADEERL